MRAQARFAVTGVAIAFLTSLGLGGALAYKNGLLWKTTLPLSDHWKDVSAFPLHRIPTEIEKARNHHVQCVEHPIGYTEAMRRLFPLASTDPTLSSSPDPKVGWVMIGYCPECRNEEKRWLATVVADQQDGP